MLTEVLHSANEAEILPADEEQKKKPRKKKVVWHSEETKVNKSIGEYEEYLEEQIEVIINILECISHFWAYEWLQFICEQSKIYAQQKFSQFDAMTVDNLRVFLEY